MMLIIGHIAQFKRYIQMSDNNKHADKSKQAQLARNWLLGAGIAALALISFLVWTDNYLTNSKGEQELNTVLKEIRTAQTSLPSRVTDNRQTAE